MIPHTYTTGIQAIITSSNAELQAKSLIEIVEYIQKEKLILILNNDLITKEIALTALKRNKDSLRCSMVDILPNNIPPLLTSKETNESGSIEENIEDADSSSEVSEGYDTYAVSQETYNQIADLLGENDYPGDCQILTVFQPLEQFTIIPVSPKLIMIIDHIINMVHEITFDELFKEKFDLK